jgi:hypothetical protein
MIRKKGKKGQAALEFLMTYAWAVLIFLIAFAVILYYDPFNLKTRLPEQVMFPPPLLVLDYGTGTGGIIKIKLKNNLEEALSISLNPIKADYHGTKECSNVTGSVNQSLISQTDDFMVTFNCSLAAGKRIDSYIGFKMNNTGNNVTHTMTGYVVLNMK